MKIRISTPQLSSILALPFFLVYIWILVRTAWVCDDAYITFRSVENFIHGYGPVYNIGERVQTFTHPLWFLVQSGANYITQRIGALNPWAQMYYVNIALSVAISILVAAQVVFGLSRSAKGAVLAALVLIVSKAFVDYSTSGLENPLTHFFIVLFLLAYLRSGGFSIMVIFLLSFVAGLSALNRLDTLLIFMPALGYAFWKSEQKGKALGVIIVGMLPLIIWELFSIFYYGVPFPNTGYAKLNTGISNLSLARQGAHYLLNSMRLDPVTLIVIIGTAIWAAVARRAKELAVVIGVGAYLLYVLYIGGDFMSGRYLVAPLLACACLLANSEFRSGQVYAGILFIVLLVGLFPSRTPLRSPLFFEGDFRDYIDDWGISDERAVYFGRLGLLSTNRQKPFPGSRFAGTKWIVQDGRPMEIKLVGPLGVAGYQAGPNVHVIDLNALADPFLVRMPLEDVNQWRIGHFRHIIPEGYLETLSAGENKIENENLARYYDKLALVVRGDLFDPQRLAEIWYLNAGRYNSLIDVRTIRE